MSEILAPAGDKKSVIAAVNAGADAVYLGLKNFSARNSAENFDYENLNEILKFCHSFGVKVYIAMNTLIKDSELEEFIISAVKVWNMGADAIIVSDICLGKFLKENYPEMVLHLSTQAGVCNSYGALLAKEYGFERVILSRETAFEDIKKIAKIIETEVFIQGALCACFSGQCFFSSFAGGNSGNRGKCKQPCRKKYSISRAGFEDSAYRLSLSDLSVGENIEKYIQSGVISFKIEGRMRRPEYVAAAVKYYRNIIDICKSDGDLRDLKRTFNRGNYTPGLAFGQDKSFISSAVQGHIGEFIGIIKVENGKYVCQNRMNFVKGDCFKIMRDGKEIGGAVYSNVTKDGFVISSKYRLKNGDKVFITTDSRLNERLLSCRRTLRLNISAEFLTGKTAKVLINGKLFEGSRILEKAVTRPVSVEDIKNTFKKTDKYPFTISFREIKTDGVFILQSELNDLRRQTFAKYFDEISSVKRAAIVPIAISSSITRKENKKVAVICKNLNNLTADIGILKLDDYNSDFKNLINKFIGEKYIYLPPYLSDSEIDSLKNTVSEFDGIYCDGIYGIKLAETLDKPLFAGCGFNISNRIDTLLCHAKYYAFSKEIAFSELKNLISDNSFCFAAGDIKIMDLVFCPFEKKCCNCDKSNYYTLTDENERKFPLRRYKTVKNCRFELFNMAPLVAVSPTGALLDCTLQKEPEKVLKLYGNCNALKEYFKAYTRGHTEQSVD